MFIGFGRSYLPAVEPGTMHPLLRKLPILFDIRLLLGCTRTEIYSVREGKMNDIELEMFLTLVVLNLVEQEKVSEVAFPLLLTFSDGTDYVFAEISWDGRRGKDIFGIGHRPLDFSKIRLPITVTAKDQNGKEGSLEYTQAMIDACIADVKKAIC